MGKIDENKRQKKEMLLGAAYRLFTQKGFNSTTISDIVEKAGVAKGTFYLYFRDKYDLKNKLIVHKTTELFDRANLALADSDVHGLEDTLIFVIDHLINDLMANQPLLHFISKNLVMGALRSTVLTGEADDNKIYEQFLTFVKEDENEYEDVNVMLFTIVELAGSSAYNSVLYNEPLSIEEYKPFLYRSVRLIIKSHQKEE